MAGCSSGRPAPNASASRTTCACAQVSGATEPAGRPGAKPIDARVGSVPYWGGLQCRVFPVLLGFQTHVGSHPLHAHQQRRGSGSVTGLQLLFAALAGQYGQRCPDPVSPVGQGRPDGAQSVRSGS